MKSAARELRTCSDIRILKSHSEPSVTTEKDMAPGKSTPSRDHAGINVEKVSSSVKSSNTDGEPFSISTEDFSEQTPSNGTIEKEQTEPTEDKVRL